MFPIELKNQKMPENNNIETTRQSDLNNQLEINDLIGNPPGFLLRSGISMIALVTGIILIGSYFFKYPDKLTGTGVLTSNTPAIEIVCRTNGYIEKIHVSEDSEVEKSDVILYINNTTNKAELLMLQRWIDEYEKVLDPRDYLNLEFVEDLQLGSIQVEYASLQLLFNEMQSSLKDGIVFQQITNISREVTKINALNASQDKEKDLYAEELDMARKDYERTKTLESEQVLSALELEKVKTVLLQKERQFQSMNNNMIQNNIRIEQLELEKLKLQEQRSNTIQDYQFRIAEVIARINASIENWNNTYTVEAPIAGKVTFSKEVVENGNLQAGQIIGYVLPSTNVKNYISAILPSTNIGKIENGQKAIIKFDAYPFKEYGTVTAEVNSVSKIPEEGEDKMPLYEIRIELPKTIITDYQDTIVYKPKMPITADIITADKSVFHRVFDQFYSIWDYDNK